jgi:hypothetical protein
MLLIIRKKADEEILRRVAEDLDGYIKVVIDIRRNILVAGGKLHVDGEQLMLEDGSLQVDLWGAGIDLETNEVDFDSMINLRPGQGNPSREVLDKGIRQQIESIMHNLLR